MRDMREDMARMERRINDRIDGVEKNLGARIDAVEARITGVETKLGQGLTASKPDFA